LKRYTILMASVLITSSLIFFAFVEPSSGQSTETWYARDTDSGLTACNGFNRDLNQTAGSVATTQDLTESILYCFYTPARTITLHTGTWTASVELRTTGVGQVVQGRITIDITDSTGAVVETIADCTTVNNPNAEEVCTVSGVPQKSLSNNRIRLRVTRIGAGSRTLTLRYGGGAGGDADTRISIPGEDLCAAITVQTSDPSGQLWFNETVEPDGQAFTTQLNVSASFQDTTTPALRVTNDGSGTCDITLRLMTDPGTGRSMKFNTTNSAPWPTDAAKEVPVDPSSVTVCSAVAPGGTCDIWLWVDYENALGGNTVVTLRVESA
jgi:hypothetical protein